MERQFKRESSDETSGPMTGEKCDDGQAYSRPPNKTQDLTSGTTKSVDHQVNLCVCLGLEEL